MYQTNLNKRSLRSVLLLGAASAAAIGMAAPASAQEQGVETVVVTGSRIPQQGLYSSSPVTAVSQQEMKLEGTTNVETLLNNLPSVFSDQTTTMSNGSNGTANIDLRGLGSKRTLVLVNGTRLMPGDPGDPVADVNDIPAALVDHVEVLTGGASAVYGSDAEAGVVNFIMRKDFEGVEFDGQYSVDEADNTNGFERGMIAPHIGGLGFNYAPEGVWDGQGETGTVLMGTNTANGKGNVTAYIGYKNQEPVLEAARDFSACTTAFSGTHLACGGSSNFDRFYSLNNSAASSAGVLKPSGQIDNFVHGTGVAGTGTFIPYVGANSQKFNYGALNYLQRNDTRWNGGFFGHYEVNKELDVYASFMFTDDDSVAQIAPSGLFLGTGTVSGSFDNVNCANPLLSAQQNFQLCGAITGDAFIPDARYAAGGYWGGQENGNCATQFGITGCAPGQATLEIGRRNIEGGNRQSDFRHTSYRAVIGSKGDLGDGWSYDVYAQYGETTTQQSILNYFSIAKSGQALQAVYNTAGTAITCAGGGAKCIPVDFYSGLGGLTPAMENSIEETAEELGSTNEGIISGSITGDFGEWGGKSPWAKSPIAVAVGAEYRDEFLTFTPDSLVSSGDLAGAGGAAPAVPKSGFNVTEGFGELQVPLVEGMPMVEDLSLKGGYRYSSYNTAGAVSTYEYGAEYQPVDDIRFRASYQRAVRAPNVLELFGPQSVTLFGGNDPCSNPTNPTVANNCANAPGANAKVSLTQQTSPLLACVAAQCNQLTGGNPNVKPEISDSRSVGMVFTPTFFEGFNATIDYFDINISKALTGGASSNAVLSACYGAGATAASQAAACPLVHRDPTTHSINTQNGYVIGTTVNEGSEGTKGFDFEANYTASFDDMGMKGWGSISINFLGTLLNSLRTLPEAQTVSYDCAGLYGYTCGSPDPKWRHKLRVTWTTPWDLDFSVQWRHLSGVHLDSNTKNILLSGACGGSSTSPAPCPDPVDNFIPAFDYIDLATDWNIREGVDLHAGVNNVFDKNPPLVFAGIAGPSQFGNGNTFPGVYDLLGRQIFVGVTIKY